MYMYVYFWWSLCMVKMHPLDRLSGENPRCVGVFFTVEISSILKRFIIGQRSPVFLGTRNLKQIQSKLARTGHFIYFLVNQQWNKLLTGFSHAFNCSVPLFFPHDSTKVSSTVDTFTDILTKLYTELNQTCFVVLVDSCSSAWRISTPVSVSSILDFFSSEASRQMCFPNFSRYRHVGFYWYCHHNWRV